MKIKREARPPRPVAVQEADRRVEADGLQRRAYVVDQERIDEGQQRVDRIERRPPCAGNREAEVVLLGADQVRRSAPK